jgi:hypothetical protein
MRALWPHTWLVVVYLLPHIAGAQDVERLGHPHPQPQSDAISPRHATGGNPVTYSPDAAELARALVSESGWVGHRDHAAQSWILRRWARRMGFSLAVAIELRVWRFSHPPRWARALSPSCEKPAGWPRRWRWDSHRDECAALFSRAERLIRGEEIDPCGGRARGWRAPGHAFLAALELGRRPVWCGRTANKYVR